MFIKHRSLRAGHYGLGAVMSARTQRQTLHAALLERPVTTLQAREEMSIMSPAPRIFELRQLGFNIVTHWVFAGTKKIAQYVLLGGEVVL